MNQNSRWNSGKKKVLMFLKYVFFFHKKFSGSAACQPKRSSILLGAIINTVSIHPFRLPLLVSTYVMADIVTYCGPNREHTKVLRNLLHDIASVLAVFSHDCYSDLWVRNWRFWSWFESSFSIVSIIKLHKETLVF